MRHIPWTDRFDRVVNWCTAFGYFDDATNRAFLDGIVRALRPDGWLAMDLNNLTAFLASYSPSRVVAAREDADMLVDRYRLDAVTGRFEASGQSSAAAEPAGSPSSNACSAFPSSRTGCSPQDSLQWPAMARTDGRSRPTIGG
jgi:hypothetical protein